MSIDNLAGKIKNDIYTVIKKLNIKVTLKNIKRKPDMRHMIQERRNL